MALLLPLHRAHLALRAQGIPRASSGNPLAANAPWKRRDLHRLGQADCEVLGGLFYFRILGFNVRAPRPPQPCLSASYRPIVFKPALSALAR